MKGFGGKFGVQTDRQDKCALGWDHQEKLQLHESQKGTSPTASEELVCVYRSARAREAAVPVGGGPLPPAVWKEAPPRGEPVSGAPLSGLALPAGRPAPRAPAAAAAEDASDPRTCLDDANQTCVSSLGCLPHCGSWIFRL